MPTQTRTQVGKKLLKTDVAMIQHRYAACGVAVRQDDAGSVCVWCHGLSAGKRWAYACGATRDTYFFALVFSFLPHDLFRLNDLA